MHIYIYPLEFSKPAFTRVSNAALYHRMYVLRVVHQRQVT